MTPEEVRELLATIANYDGRAVDARTIMDWHEALKSIPFDLAKAAVTLWYQTNRGWVQVHDVAAGAIELAGLGEVETVTSRRLEGLSQPWDSEQLGPVMVMPEIEGKNNED